MVYQLFNNLFQQGKHREIVNLLNQFMDNNNLSILEKGWALWNISDSYAIMREPLLEHQNHINFVEWGKDTLHPDKLHWFVSDGTQALTLSLGNKLDDWIEWYEYACKYSSKNKDNRGVRFESHRAMAATFIKLNMLSSIGNPLNRMKELIEEDGNWENIIFSKITYYSLLLEKGYKLNDYVVLKDAKDNIQSLMNDVSLELKNGERKESLLGSWEELNESRQSRRAMLVLLHNLGCTFSETTYYQESVEVFSTAIDNGVNITKYGVAMYLLSIWEQNKDKTQIETLFSKLVENRYEFKELYKFASSLEKVL
ncbi:MAG: hypothetical protein NAG76_02445 [Candidatus Pristimantibacillus lignocellulolyticus]|uniref:Uncharacterized protein n=1 Tax=Candidatus Pristimantibacillus lignocellulolyticus TaxID=2994561 RepID=A0A9J6ZGZ1_9BACL|nr:MAG: hypothetical protein NAG76_02445 [Candidatus Pristimantibacillus lignocellulolyticus]